MLTLTKNIIKEIRSLEQRRSRREQGAWLAEGNKMVADLLTSGTFSCLRLVATAEWWQQHPQWQSVARESYLATAAEIDRTSLQQTPQDVLAVFALPATAAISSPTSLTGKTDAEASAQAADLSIVLDEIQDPGNLGTIIRTADWFGVRHIYCAPGTADCFSPKVVQATMSALARVHVHYFDTKEHLIAWLRHYQGPIYGTFLEGADIYHTDLKSHGLLVMGNEGRGVSAEVAACVTDKILIPHFSPDGQHVESLNVSVATAICLSELRRR